MIGYKFGNILNEEVEAAVNTVNCVGVMGRGIALQFKNTYPENFKVYAAACKRGEVQPGKMFVFPTDKMVNPRWIINFPTKRHWRENSRMEDIDAGLTDLIQTIKRLNIRSIAVPPLGCGLGGLDWTLVREKISNALGLLPNVRVVVFEPQGSPSPENMMHVQKAPKMTAGRAALVLLMNNYLCGLLDPFITLLETHKLMYFMQEAGEKLRLKYIKAHYGPYAENLRHVFNEIEGYYISGYADGGDAPEKQLTLFPSAIEDANAFLLEHTDTLQRIGQVSKLVKGFESAFGLELLATVHWVVKREHCASVDDVVCHVHNWSDRKRWTFSPRQISIAVNMLADKGWISHFEN